MKTPKVTLSQIRQHNAAQGHYFFSKETTRFFRSRYYPSVYQGNGGIFFVHSSTFQSSTGDSLTTYAVAHYNPETGDVNNVSVTKPFAYLDDAREYAKNAAKRSANPE